MDAFERMLARHECGRERGKLLDTSWCRFDHSAKPPTAAEPCEPPPDPRLAPIAPFVRRAVGRHNVATIACVTCVHQAPGTLGTRYRERTAACCPRCFEAGAVCWAGPERRLALLIIGHNPSDRTWQEGFQYANPSNWMWRLLSGQGSTRRWRGIVRPGTPVRAQNELPATHRVGFIDVMRDVRAIRVGRVGDAVGAHHLPVRLARL